MQRAGSDIPRLTIEAPEQLAAARSRLESFDTGRLRGVMHLVGLDNAGDPIRVVLVSEGSALARRAPPPIAGFASLDEGLIVLFPARSPAYPHDTLEDVLHHEVAHVLISRAARGALVPLWFHEGLAVLAERTWRLEDDARLLRELVLVSRTPLDRLDALFAADGASRARAYTLAAAFVRDINRRHGADAAARILRRVGDGDTFERAFAQATGESVSAAESAFWNSHRFWTSIGPFLTTQTALWMIVTMVGIYAIIRRRQQRAAQRARWEEQGDDPSRDARDRLAHSPGLQSESMHSFVEVVAALNDLKDRGIVSAYAIAGAMAVTFWAEPIATFDLDVLVVFPGTDTTITSLEPIYLWAAEHGYEARAEHIVIGDVPVQFLPAYNALAEEAVTKARTLDYRGLPVAVVSPEYLIGLALDPVAKTARRKERAAMLAEAPALDKGVLEDIMARYDLSW